MIVTLKKNWKRPSGKVLPKGKRVEVTNELGKQLIDSGMATHNSNSVRDTIIVPIKEKKEDKKIKENK